MVKPIRCLFFTQLALSTALLAFEEESELFDDELYEEKSYISDLSQYPTVAECFPSSTSSVRHHYVLMGEMLYLKPSLDSMPWLYQYDNSQDNDPAVSSTTYMKQSDKLKMIDLPSDFGFRVAAGFNTTWMNMEFLVSWERLYTHKNSSVSPLPVVNFSDPTFNQPVTYYSFWNSTITQPANVGQIYFANNKTKFHWNQIDLTGKIPLKAAKRFSLSPVLGVRGVISSFQTKTNFYTTQYGVTNTTTPPFNENITDVKQNFRAIGLLGGLDGDLDFGMGFHLSTLVEGALVFGNLKSYNNEQLNTPVVPTRLVPTTYNTSISSQGFKPIVDAQVALSWNYSFWKDKLTLNMHIGYEAHYVPNFFQLIYYLADNGDNETTIFYDLTVQGLDAGLGLSF